MFLAFTRSGLRLELEGPTPLYEHCTGIVVRYSNSKRYGIEKNAYTEVRTARLSHNPKGTQLNLAAQPQATTPPQSPVSPVTYTLYSTPRSLCAVYLLFPHICPSRAALPVPAYAAAGPGRHVARPSGSITRQSLRL